MDTLNLELIIESHPIYGEPIYIDLPVAIHVHKRLEQFLYLNSIREDAAPIAYLSNPVVDAWKNLLITNKSHSVLVNSPSLLAGERRFDSVIATAFSSPYSSIIATDQDFTDSKGRVKPLFYRHALPEGVTEASLEELSNGNKVLVDEGYKVDIATRSIYTNYRNRYDADTGAYKLFFVTASTSTGEVVNTLLNAQPVAKEATWEDIDLTSGKLVTNYPLYSVEKTGRGYTYYFNRGAKWYIRLQDKGLIAPRRPRAKRPDSPWYIQFTNGDVSGVVNGTVRRYSIPEFATQPFVPYKPIKYGNKEDLLFVNRKVLATTRPSLVIDPTIGLHTEITIEDEEGNLLKVYTTDLALDGLRYSNTDVFYETDKIASWDNYHGFIALTTNIFPNWKYHAKYYYKVEDYEYTLVNLNPITNRKLKDHIYCFYCLPDAATADRAVHYVLVNQDGIIVEASQTLGITHPNLQLRNSAGTYNPNTVIGMLYFSEVEESFLSTYAAGFANSNGYLILAEVSGVDPSLVEDQLDIDLRRPGAIIKEALYNEAIRANPRILQSKLGFGTEGQVVPETNVVVLEAPLSLLIEYGGLLTVAQAEALLRANMASSGYAVIQWVYPHSEINGSAIVADQLTINLTWEGDYTYRFYRRDSGSSTWELINEEVSPAEGVISYTDGPLDAGYTYEYASTIVENGIEYPYSHILSMKVR